MCLSTARDAHALARLRLHDSERLQVLAEGNVAEGTEAAVVQEGNKEGAGNSSSVVIR